MAGRFIDLIHPYTSDPGHAPRPVGRLGFGDFVISRNAERHFEAVRVWE